MHPVNRPPEFHDLPVDVILNIVQPSYFSIESSTTIENRMFVALAHVSKYWNVLMNEAGQHCGYRRFVVNRFSNMPKEIVKTIVNFINPSKLLLQIFCPTIQNKAFLALACTSNKSNALMYKLADKKLEYGEFIQFQIQDKCNSIFQTIEHMNSSKNFSVARCTNFEQFANNPEAMEELASFPKHIFIEEVRSYNKRNLYKRDFFRDILAFSFPNGLGMNLVTLHIGFGISVKYLPNGLTSLKTLSLCRCPIIEKFPLDMKAVTSLFLSECTALEELPPNSEGLISLYIKDCVNLKYFPSEMPLLKTMHLENIWIEDFPKTISLTEFSFYDLKVSSGIPDDLNNNDVSCNWRYFE